MKRSLSLILCLVMTACAFVTPSFALPPQDTSCTAGFVGGDVDGDGKVTATDAAQLMQYLTGWSIPGDASHADTLRDGIVNAKDAAKLMQYLAGWNVGRLCHDDEYVIVKDSTVMEQGTARRVCRVCGDFVEETIPYKTLSVCGTELSEYHFICASQNMGADIINASTDELLGCYCDFEMISSKNKSKKTYDHEILVGDVNMFRRDGLPELEQYVPCYGVTEDGTVYFHVTNLGLFNEMWLEFLRERLGADFHIVNTIQPHIELVSYDENGGDVQPFCRTYETLDLEAEGYKLVFEDNFDGDSFDLDAWAYRASGARRGGFNAPSQVEVRDGALRITAEYRKDGTYGEGWYSGMVALKKNYSRGYFEASIKCSDYDGGFWSAFWMQGKSPYVPDQSQGGVGPGGCELDIIEMFGDGGASYNLHCAGGKYSDKPDTYESYGSLGYSLGDLLSDYHVFALEWDEDFYTFYVDGILVGRTAFADGTASAEEQVILSLELSENLTPFKEYTTEMAVDYIRIYQK